MVLNDRKIQILQAIINDYIETAEPVGSRTIAKKYDLGISSATIRNEMSDLEDMGLIIQRHASSGRIPSDSGYRLYVDHILQKEELEEEEQKYLQGIVSRDISQIDYLMQETARILSSLTHYPTIISEPVRQRIVMKQIRLLPLDDSSVLLVIATDDNYIKNHIINMPTVPTENDIFKISQCLNETFKGYTLSEFNEDMIYGLQEKLGMYEVLIQPVLKAIETTMIGAEKTQLYMSGTKNILEFPEFSDVNKAKPIFQALEEKEVLITLLEESRGNDLQVLIGSENNVQNMQDCSVITATYKLSDDTSGTIGVVGPTRMDYSQVISVLNNMVRNIENVLKDLTDKKH